MKRPLALDLYCGQGGAAMGYHRADFNVVGVDLYPQPRYPFKFIQADALDFLVKHGSLFDFIHASPPCHDHTTLKSMTGQDGSGWLLDATRTELVKLDVPWVIENVMGAKMFDPIVLCGTEFGLTTEDRRGALRELRRHRQFESSERLCGAGGCRHSLPVMGVYGHGGGNTTRDYMATKAEAASILGIDWMDRAGLSQSVPPAYTEFLGCQVLAAIEGRVAA